MPIGYVIAKERRLVITTASGRVTFSEFQSYHDGLVKDPDFRPEFDQLVDGTAIGLLDITIEEAKAIADRKVFSSGSRRAFVATSPDVFGLTRLAQMYLARFRESSRIHLFPDVPSALKWLDLEGQ